VSIHIQGRVTEAWYRDTYRSGVSQAWMSYTHRRQHPQHRIGGRHVEAV